MMMKTNINVRYLDYIADVLKIRQTLFTAVYFRTYFLALFALI